IIPIVLCDTPMPPLLGEYQWIDAQQMARHACARHKFSAGSSTNASKKLRPRFTEPRRLIDIWRENRPSESRVPKRTGTQPKTTLNSLGPLALLELLLLKGVGYLAKKYEEKHPPLNHYDSMLLSTAVLTWSRSGNPSA